MNKCCFVTKKARRVRRTGEEFAREETPHGPQGQSGSERQMRRSQKLPGSRTRTCGQNQSALSQALQGRTQDAPANCRSA